MRNPLLAAIMDMADHARLNRLPPPVITMPLHSLLILKRAIESSLGATASGLLGSLPLRGFQFDGVAFVPQRGKPRIRVKAGGRVISTYHYSLHQWTADEAQRAQVLGRPPRPAIVRNKVTGSRWMV